MTKEEIQNRKADYKVNQYQHGGSRIFIDGESGDRELIIDTHLDKDFAEYIDRCVRGYFGFGEDQELLEYLVRKHIASGVLLRNNTSEVDEIIEEYKSCVQFKDLPDGGFEAVFDVTQYKLSQHPDTVDKGLLGLDD